MPQNPAYSVNGNPYFESTTVSFQVVFDNEGDSPGTQSYQWYLDGILVLGADGQTFLGDVACGNHKIGARVLFNNQWTGIEEVTFETCRTISQIVIEGPAQVAIGENAAYLVIASFSDDSSADYTNQYTFSCTSGGSFSGNIFTATGDGAGIPPFGLTITATPTGSLPTLTKNITVISTDTTSLSILVVDLFSNPSLNVIGLVDNPEVTENHIAAYTGANVVPTGSAPATATILASDIIAQDTLNWRFEFNLLKLRHQYPATNQFKLVIKGRGTEAGMLNGAYVVYNPEGTMIMTSGPGTYLPSVSGGSIIVSQTSINANITDGANGSYNEADLATIIVFVYTVSNNSVTTQP